VIRAVALSLACVAAAHADPPRDGAGLTADDLKARAEQHYAKHQLIGARLDLLAAYALEPHADTLFALGQVDYNLGLYTEAIEKWRAYLDSHPDEGEAARTQQAIGAANTKLHEVITFERVSQSPLVRRWDGSETALVIIGGVALAAGATAMYEGHALGNDMSGTLSAYDDRIRAAHRYQWGGAGAATAGALAVVGALSRYVLHREPEGGLAVTSTTVSVTLGGSL
jgi:tetratricopeptide (TPR) repeat protein